MNHFEIPKKIVLYGGSGQAKLVRPIIESYGSQIIAVIDDTPGLLSPFKNVPLFHGYQNFLKWYHSQKLQAGYLITIGNPHAEARLRLHELLNKDGLTPFALVSKTADLPDDIEIGVGSQILNSAYIAVEAKLGKSCIINAGAHIDHESHLDEGVELGPGTIVCGCVNIGKNTWIGAGSVVRDHITIGQNVIVGAGSVVVKNIPDNHVVAGIPSKTLRNS